MTTSCEQRDYKLLSSYTITLDEKKCKPCKDSERSLHLMLSLKDLPSKSIPCKDLTRKCNPCRIVQGNTFFARICKEINSLQDSCRILVGNTFFSQSQYRNFLVRFLIYCVSGVTINVTCMFLGYFSRS